MPPNRFESEVESFLEGSHGDRTHIKRADHHTVTPLCGTLLAHNADHLAHDTPLSAFVAEVVCTLGATPPRTATSPPPNGRNCAVRGVQSGSPHVEGVAKRGELHH